MNEKMAELGFYKNSSGEYVLIKSMSTEHIANTISKIKRTGEKTEFLQALEEEYVLRKGSSDFDKIIARQNEYIEKLRQDYNDLISNMANIINATKKNV
jgi:hypothetical protein